MRRIGRRPYLSDSRPSTGEKISCITEYEANSRPTSRGVAPKPRALGVIRQHWNYDSKADQIDKDRDEDDQEWRALHKFIIWSAATCRRFQKARLVAPTKALTSQRTPKLLSAPAAEHSIDGGLAATTNQEC